LEFGIWAKKVREELNKIGLGYIWHDSKENSVSRIVKHLNAII
jgi:alpha-glucosidase (family GH31 glycosyl hydrolase)